mgnify:CR=1 FL=1
MNAMAEQKYKILRERDFADSFNSTDQFALDVLVGLTAQRKSLPSKYFYDAKGSELFNRITELPEYYPTICSFANFNMILFCLSTSRSGKKIVAMRLSPAPSMESTLPSPNFR